jgi:hypothetical protein
MNMMTNQLERQEIQAVIREYQQQGYEVIAPEEVENLPVFFKDYQPELVLKKAGEMVVVEVRTRSKLTDPTLASLAQEIEQQPGWRLDLVVFPQEEKSQSISNDEIRDRLNRTRQLTELGQFEAAFLMAGSAIEATLRTMCDRENISASTKEVSALTLLKTSVSLGLLENTEYKILQRGLELRDKLAHGLQLTEANSSLIHNQAFIRQLLEIVEQLISSFF